MDLSLCFCLVELTSKLFNSSMLNQKYWNVHKNVKPILSNLWRFQEPKIFYFQLTVYCI